MWTHIRASLRPLPRSIKTVLMLCKTLLVWGTPGGSNPGDPLKGNSPRRLDALNAVDPLLHGGGGDSPPHHAGQAADDCQHEAPPASARVSKTPSWLRVHLCYTAGALALLTVSASLQWSQHIQPTPPPAHLSTSTSTTGEPTPVTPAILAPAPRRLTQDGRRPSSPSHRGKTRCCSAHWWPASRRLSPSPA